MSTDELASLTAAARDAVRAIDGPLSRLQLATGRVSVEIVWASRSGTATPARAAGPAEPAGPEAAPAEPGGATIVSAAVSGTFYVAAEPGSDPFVRAGDAVDDDTQVGIIEAMKLMTPVTAGARGVVAEILVSDAERVQSGQPLLRLHPILN